MRQAAASLRAQHAKTVRVIDDQPGVETLGQRQQRGQVGHIAVHAEDGVGDDQLDRRGAGRQLTFQHGEVFMRVTLQRRFGQQRAIDQRGVVQFVGKNRRARVAQRRQQRQVRHKAGAEIRRLRVRNARREPRGQFVFERRVGQRMAADQMRRAAARAVTLRAFGQRGYRRRVVRQPQIIVAAKRQQLTLGAAVEGNPLARCAGRHSGAALAAQ